MVEVPETAVAVYLKVRSMVCIGLLLRLACCL
jgi:hypothetical protein